MSLIYFLFFSLQPCGEGILLTLLPCHTSCSLKKMLLRGISDSGKMRCLNRVQAPTPTAAAAVWRTHWTATPWQSSFVSSGSETTQFTPNTSSVQHCFCHGDLFVIFGTRNLVSEWFIHRFWPEWNIRNYKMALRREHPSIKALKLSCLCHPHRYPPLISASIFTWRYMLYF